MTWRNHTPSHQSKAGKAGYASLVAKGKEGLASKKAAEYRLKNPTELERILISWFTLLEVEYEREKSIDKFYADAVVKSVVIEANGARWHELEDLRPGQKERDKGKYRKFNELGYTVLVLPESKLRDGTGFNELKGVLNVH